MIEVGRSSESDAAMSVPSPLAPPSPLLIPGGRWVHYALILATFLGALAPTLSWVEFTGGMENACVATAMETAREGHWLFAYVARRAAYKEAALCTLAYRHRYPFIQFSCHWCTLASPAERLYLASLGLRMRSLDWRLRYRSHPLLGYAVRLQ